MKGRARKLITNALRFLHMLYEHRGLETARILLHPTNLSEMFALSSSHEAQIDPHRLLYSHVVDVHDKRIWQIRRPILPCGQRWPCILRIDRPQANSQDLTSA